MAEKKVLVLNPQTGELQQLQSNDTVFGLSNGQIAATQTFVNDAVAVETTARQAAEATLQTNINNAASTAANAVLAEQTARIAADAGLAEAIAAEVTSRSAAVNTLTTNLAAEVTRATNAETSLQDNIDNEASVREAADTSLASAIAAISSGSSDALAAEITARKAADSTLQANITSEQSARTTAINALAADIAAEVTARSNADTAINNAIASEVTARKAADADLQAQINTLSSGSSDALAAEITARQAADATLTANLATEVTARQAADTALQTAINAEATARTNADNALQTNIDGKVAKAGDTMTGFLTLHANPSDGLHAATKNYVDSLAGGLSWQQPVVGIGATNPATATTGDRFVNTTDDKIYTATAANTWDNGVTPADGYAVFDKSTETGYVFSGTDWVQFTGTGQITAGLGLAKNGNRLDIELADASGLTFAPNEVDETAKLAVELKAAGGISKDADGLFIGAGAITNAMLASNEITIDAETGSDTISLGGNFAIMGDNASGIRTSIDAATNTLTIDALNASSSQKGVASFGTDFTVTDGNAALSTTGVTAGNYGSATAIPTFAVDSKGRLTAAGSVAIDTASSAVSMVTTGCDVGDAVYVNGSGAAVKAQANVGSTVKVVGFVVADGKVATAGVVSGLSGLTPGARYFLSAGTAGAITTTAPSADGQYVAAVGIATSATTLAIQIATPVQL